MKEIEYRESCREIEKNIHILESEIKALNDECERLWDFKEKGRSNLRTFSLENNPVFVKKVRDDVEKETPIMYTPQNEKDKSEISQDKNTQINQFCPYCGAEVSGMRFCGKCGKRVN